MRTIARLVLIVSGIGLAVVAVLQGFGSALGLVAGQLQLQATADRLPFDPVAEQAAADTIRTRSAREVFGDGQPEATVATTLAQPATPAAPEAAAQSARSAQSNQSTQTAQSPQSSAAPEAVEAARSVPPLPQSRPSQSVAISLPLKRPAQSAPSLAEAASDDDATSAGATGETRTAAVDDDAERVVYVRAALRSEPDSDAESITLLDKGTEVRVVDRDGEWAMVQAPATGETGWVLAKQMTTAAAYAAAVAAERDKPQVKVAQRSRGNARARRVDPRYAAVVLPDGRVVYARRSYYPNYYYGRYPYYGQRVVVVRRYSWW